MESQQSFPSLRRRELFTISICKGITKSMKVVKFHQYRLYESKKESQLSLFGGKAI